MESAATVTQSALKSISPNSPRYCLYGYHFDVPNGSCVQSIQSGTSPNRLRVETLDRCFVIKPCHKCKRLLPLEEFYSGKGACRSCHKVVVKRWQVMHPDNVKRYRRKSNKRYYLIQKGKS